MPVNIKLYRKIEDRIRYYYIELNPTLFYDFILVRKYGNIRFKAPTGRRINYFETESEAEKFLGRLLRKKMKKGIQQLAIFILNEK